MPIYRLCWRHVFLKQQKFSEECFKCFKSFSNFSGLRPNLDKCETAGIGVLKNAYVALCGMKNINLTKESIKISGNKKIQDNSNFCKTIKNLCTGIKLWHMKKSLAISKIAHLTIITKFKYCDRGIKANPKKIFVG